MKKTLLLVVFATVGLSYSASARLGEGVSAIEMRYGKPTHAIKHGSSEERNTKRIGGDSAAENEYVSNGFKITVEFSKGVSVKETYYRSEGIDEGAVAGLLEANSNGKKWTPVEAIKSKSSRRTEQKWTRQDGVFAIFAGGRFTVSAGPKGF